MRYIDAHKLRKLIKSHETVDKALALTLVNSTPTEDTLKHGEWKISVFGKEHWVCPFCNRGIDIPKPFCSICGARLRCWWEGEDETTV